MENNKFHSTHNNYRKQKSIIRLYMKFQELPANDSGLSLSSKPNASTLGDINEIVIVGVLIKACSDCVGGLILSITS